MKPPESAEEHFAQQSARREHAKPMAGPGERKEQWLIQEWVFGTHWQQRFTRETESAANKKFTKHCSEYPLGKFRLIHRVITDEIISVHLREK